MNTKEYDGLLQDILEHPDEDGPRLIMADWLEENTGQVVCDTCVGHGGHILPHANHPIGKHNAMSLEDFEAGAKTDWRGDDKARWSRCRGCLGEGWISDGYTKLAEFIRLQIILTAHPTHHTLLTGCPLRTREQELWMHSPFVRAAIYRTLPKDVGWSIHYGNTWDGSIPPSVFVRRGFVAEVHLTMKEYEDHAAALFSAHPIERVVLTDREPMDYIGGGFIWYDVSRGLYAAELGHENPHVLLHDVFMLLDDHKDRHNDFKWKMYVDMDQAMKALVSAATKAGRQRARDKK